MVRRYKKSSRKYLGSRSWGRGNIKHGRGKGSKGGKGLGGGHKQKWVWMIKNMPGHFKRKSMVSIKKDLPVANLWQIQNQIDRGIITKGPGGKYEVKIAGKVLGAGKLNAAVVIHAEAFAKGAIEKIKKAGGEAKVMQKNEKGLVANRGA